MTLTLRHLGDCLLIEVFDHDNRPPTAAGNGLDWSAESGRGLAIVEALCRKWDFFLLPTGGKVVWCEIGLEFPDQSLMQKSYSFPPQIADAMTVLRGAALPNCGRNTPHQ